MFSTCMIYSGVSEIFLGILYFRILLISLFNPPVSLNIFRSFRDFLSFLRFFGIQRFFKDSLGFFLWSFEVFLRFESLLGIYGL